MAVHLQQLQHPPGSPSLPCPHTLTRHCSPTSIRSISHSSRSWDVPGGEQRETSTKAEMIHQGRCRAKLSKPRHGAALIPNPPHRIHSQGCWEGWGEP